MEKNTNIIEKLKYYLNEYKEVADTEIEKHPETFQYYNFCQKFFQKDKMENKTWNDFQELGNNLNCFVNFPLAQKRAFGKPNHELEYYKDTFRFMLDESIPLEKRINDFLSDEKYKIGYITNGKFEIIGYRFPENYIIKNKTSDNAIKVLGKGLDFNFIEFNKFLNEEIKIQNLYKNIVGKRTNYPINIEIDRFLYWLATETEAGKKINRKVWIFAAGEGATLWDNFYKDGIMAIGWEDVGNLQKYKKQADLKQEIQKLNKTPDKNYANRVKALWDICKIVSVNDIVYVKKGLRDVIGRGVVTSDYLYDESRKGYEHYREVNWTSNKEFENVKDSDFARKALTEITKDTELCEKLENLYSQEPNNPNETANKEDTMIKPLNQILYGPPGTGKTYKLKSIIKEYIQPQIENKYENLLLNCGLNWIQKLIFAYKINNPQNKPLKDTQISKLPLIQIWFEISNEYKDENSLKDSIRGEIQTNAVKENGEPYAGQKTNYFKRQNDGFILTGEGENEYKKICEQKQIEIEYNTFCTFHQSYSYEEFVEGIKPVINKNSGYQKNNKQISYEYKDGIFKDICTRARKEPQNKFFIFIDEINRGNISKIFGELITLIEEDKREGVDNAITVTLPYSGDTFSVPNNLYIIGTMNTSDRSIASVDIALRRRFKFVEMMPEPSVVPENIKDEKGKKVIVKLRDMFETLNKRICALLDRDHQIGHSYFKDVKTISDLKDVWFDSVMPLLNEYFYGDWEKLQAILGKAEDENGVSFIQKFETKDIFAKDVENPCDETEYYDFRRRGEYYKEDNKDNNEMFIGAISNAFSTVIEEG